MNESHSSLKYYKYGSCTFSEKLSLSLNIHIVLSLLIVLVTFGIQITLFFKQRKLKNERELGIMVVTYNNNGVTISRRSANQSLGRKLINYDRTVVSPKGSFLVFVSNALRVLILMLLFFIQGSSYPSIVLQFEAYVEFCVFFVLFPLIETIFSPTLSYTMIDYITLHRRAYTVNV